MASPRKTARASRPNYPVWLGLFFMGVVVTLAAKYFPAFPGDLALAKGVQSLVPANLTWAAGVSRSAEFPWLFVILALIVVLSWALAGRRAALLAILSLAGMLALGSWLGPVIARPRPSPELVRVFRPLSGSSCPSLFALRYAATFGFLAVLAAVTVAGSVRSVILTLCVTLLVLGFLARLALGAHWPSDVIISYFWGLFWAACLIRFTSQDIFGKPVGA